MANPIKVLGPNEVVNPQHMQFLFRGIDDSRRRLTKYTGLLTVGHGAAGSGTPLDIQYPLIGLFKDPPGTKGILPLSTPVLNFQEFRAATAAVSIANFRDKTDECIVAVEAVRVELTEIVLADVNSKEFRIHAVVLFATVRSRNSDVTSLGYEVNVLERISSDVGPEDSDDHLDKELLRPFRPRLLNEPPFNWNGKYHDFGGTLGCVVPGAHAVWGAPQLFS